MEKVRTINNDEVMQAQQQKCNEEIDSQKKNRIFIVKNFKLLFFYISKIFLIFVL